jgi:DNA-directed RNA polymerase specialized sigma24 family protein
MTPEGSVSTWLGLLKGGDTDAAQPLWERYFRRLVGLARTRLREAPRRVADEEDVAICAFNSFCRGVEGGRFPKLADRDDLWRVLVVLTARKAAHLLRDQNRQKRGGLAEPLRIGADDGEVEAVLSTEPTPEFAAETADEFRRLLGRLQDQELEQVAVWKLEGFTNDEIAERLACAPRTVERKLRLIREVWEASA